MNTNRFEYFLVARNVARSVYKRVPFYHVFDGYPYLYINPRTNQKAIICFLEKVGSTAWKTLLLKSFNAVPILTVSPHIAEYKNKYTPKVTREMFEAALRNPVIPKIMFVRNPYSRLLSGFIDKVYNVTDPSLRQKFFKGFKASNKNFNTFIKYVKGVHERDNHPNNSKPPFLNSHYIPQSERCFINVGMRYNYYLKVEQTPIWYPYILNLLGLVREASSGWDFGESFRNQRSNATTASGSSVVTTRAANKTAAGGASSADDSATTSTTISTTTTTTTTTTSKVGDTSTTVITIKTTTTNSTTASEAETIIDDSPSQTPTCFYSPPGVSCHALHESGGDAGSISYSTTCQYNGSTEQGYNLTVESLLSEGSFVGRSVAAMKDLYTPQNIADVTSFAERDLLMFGYPYWDGRDVMQYVKDIAEMPTTANCTDLALNSS